MTDDLNRHLSALVDDAVPTEAPGFSEVLKRRRRRRTTRLAVGATVVAVAAVAIGVPTVLAGGPDGGPSPAPAPSTQSPSDPTAPDRPDPTYEWGNDPSPIVVRLADRDVELAPWTSCWGGPPDQEGVTQSMCSDGMPGTVGELPDVGGVEGVDFWFGRPGWSFDATFTPVGDDCPRQTTVRATRTGAQWFHLDPAAAAGRYQVDLFGRGPEGDVITSFVWTTPVDGPLDPPRATIALVTDDGDDLMSYGLEVSVQDLAEQPRTASVEVTATAANGESMVLTAPRADRPADCHSRGSLFFQDNDPSAVADLGPAPFRYEVVLTLDGEEYVGTAVWPRDETKHQAPYTTLTFEPPLPGASLGE